MWTCDKHKETKVLSSFFFSMTRNLKPMTFSPRQVLNHQRVLKILRLDMMKITKIIGPWHTYILFPAEKLNKAVQKMTRINIDIFSMWWRLQDLMDERELAKN